MKKLFRYLLLSLAAIMIISGIPINICIDKVSASTSIDVHLNADAQDECQTWNGTALVHSGSQYIGKVTNTYGILYVFPEVNIPIGSTIDNAYITLTCSTASSGTTVKLRITGDDEDDAAVYTTSADFAARRGTVVGGANNNYITTANVAWDGLGAWTLGTSYNTPDIKSIVQEIVDRPGWVALNNMAFFIDDYEGRGTSSRRPANYENTTYTEPILHIEYSGAVVVPTVTTGSASSIGSTTVTLGGNITNTGGENCTIRIVEYGTVSGNYTTSTNATGDFGTGAFTIDVTGLDEATFYYWRAGAANSAGYGYGSQGYFWTSSTQTVSFINPYVGGNAYKGNLHGHSTNSNAENEWSPTEYVQAYLDEGYDFVSLTDYDQVTADPAVSGIVFFTGTEDRYIDVNGGHIGSTGALASYTIGHTWYENIALHISDNACVWLNHPDASVWPWSEAEIDIALTIGVTGLEVYNATFYENDAEPIWDYALSQNASPIWGIGVDDSRNSTIFADGWTIVFANEKTHNAIKAALKAGNCYASSGANITSINVIGDTISVSSNISSTITFKGKNGVTLQETTATSANYTATGGEKYVRVVISNADGKAWTQPFEIVLTGVAVPTVVTNTTINIEETTATASGDITAASSNTTYQIFEFGTATGTYTDNVTTNENLGVGEMQFSLAGLIPGELYFGRAGAKIDGDIGWGDEVSWIQKPDPAADFHSIGSSSSQINLTWTNGAGMDLVGIRYSTGSVPSDNETGTQGYWGNASSVNIIGLSDNTTYYFRIDTYSYEGGLWNKADGDVTCQDTTDEISDLPDGVLTFTAVRTFFDEISMDWTKSANAIGVKIIARYGPDYPAGYDDDYEIYYGENVSYITMPVSRYMDINISIWEYNDSGWSEDYQTVSLGGVPLEITNSFPIAYIGLILGCILIIAAYLFKSPIIWVAALVCFIGVYFEPDLFDTYYQIAVGIVMVFCLIMATFHYQAKRYNRG